MRYIIYDEEYKFNYAFDTKTGAYFRSGILDKNGIDTGVNPFMGSFPHLLDIGIMGHCIHGKTGLCKKAGIDCYQSGLLKSQPNMTLANFKKIVEECKGRTNQFALGGRGDPDQHENFEEILKICAENNIVPNFTTSGYGMTEKIAKLCKKYCGAVAVSWYRNEYTLKAIDLLIKNGVITNIHYVLNNKTIDEAIDRLENKTFPQHIYSLIFLLHKPVGQGSVDDVLDIKDKRVIKLFNLIDNSKNSFQIGIDSCSIPGVINLCKNVMKDAVDTCDGARFSGYISPDMIMTPCSFDQKKEHGVSLNNMTIEEAWNSEQFNQFRQKLKNACHKCSKRQDCMGGCPICREIVLCDSEYRD